MSEQKQLGQFHGVVLQNLPELTSAQLQAGIKNPLRVQKILAGLQDALRGTFKLATIECDMTGWKCLEPVEITEGEFEPDLQEFLREGESYVGGEEMVKRAKDRTGLRHAEAMLREQDKIPVDYRKYVLVFPEVWQGPGGRRNVFYLHWNGRRWVLDCNWLGNDFNSNVRLVRPRKYQK